MRRSSVDSASQSSRNASGGWTREHRHLTTDVPPISFGFRVELEDFQVQEVPAYPPSGEGEHLLVHIEKRGIPSDQAAKRMARAFGVSSRDVGMAGRKDARGVTRQWFSFPGVEASLALEFEDENLRVLEAARHGNKIRRGHLKGNRFQLRLRDLDPARDADVQRVCAAVQRHGMPNAYGPQRFGARGDNADMGALLLQEGRAAHAAALGARKPSAISKTLRTLHVNALQSRIFNRVVAARLEHPGGISSVVLGDLAQKTDSGGIFLVEDDTDARRAAEFEISATGPMHGSRMDDPAGEPLAIEEAALAVEGLSRSAFGSAGALSQRGTRRALRVRVGDLATMREGSDVLLTFGLPSGSFATTLVEELEKRSLSVSEGIEGPSGGPGCR
jgi:tRNA pseudouridine13 synthase